MKLSHILPIWYNPSVLFPKYWIHPFLFISTALVQATIIFLWDYYDNFLLVLIPLIIPPAILHTATAIFKNLKWRKKLKHGWRGPAPTWPDIYLSLQLCLQICIFFVCLFCFLYNRQSFFQSLTHCNPFGFAVLTGGLFPFLFTSNIPTHPSDLNEMPNP